MRKGEINSEESAGEQDKRHARRVYRLPRAPMSRALNRTRKRGRTLPPTEISFLSRTESKSFCELFRALRGDAESLIFRLFPKKVTTFSPATQRFAEGRICAVVASMLPMRQNCRDDDEFLHGTTEFIQGFE